MTKLLVSELYDKLTVQGEGKSIGQLCSFIRLGGCNLHCKWCDTSYTWRFSDKFSHNYAPVYDSSNELQEIEIEDIVNHFRAMNPPMMIITGGEPMLQAKKLPELITWLINEIPALTRVEIETAGTIFDDRIAEFPFVYFNVSPKLENSGNPLDLRYKPQVLKSFDKTDRAIFKFVVCGDKDLDEVQAIVNDVKIPNHKVYIMAEGIDPVTQTDRLQAMVDKIIERRWNITTRLHVMIWGNKRGV